MKKTYLVIDNKYVVDKEVALQIDDWYLQLITNGVDDGELKVWKWKGIHQPPLASKIIAVIGEQNRIQGLPVIVIGKTPLDGFKAGYKAAQSKGSWTDEDMVDFARTCLGFKSYNDLRNVNDILEEYKKQSQEIKEIELEVEVIHADRAPGGFETFLEITHPSDNGGTIIVNK